jgi:hypothetical protein
LNKGLASQLENFGGSREEPRPLQDQGAGTSQLLWGHAAENFGVGDGYEFQIALVGTGKN